MVINENEILKTWEKEYQEIWSSRCESWMSCMSSLHRLTYWVLYCALIENKSKPSIKHQKRKEKEKGEESLQFSSSIDGRKYLVYAISLFSSNLEKKKRQRWLKGWCMNIWHLDKCIYIENVRWKKGTIKPGRDYNAMISARVHQAQCQLFVLNSYIFILAFRQTPRRHECIEVNTSQ